MRLDFPKVLNFSKKWRLTIIVLLIVVFVVSATSCIAEIDPSAANSSSAFMATLGEYILAIFSILIVLFIHILRVSAIAVSAFSIYMMCMDKDIFNIDPILVLFLGILTFLFSTFIPIKQYHPIIIISKRSGNIKKSKYLTTKDSDFIKDISVGVVSGVLLIFIEKIFF